MYRMKPTLEDCSFSKLVPIRWSCNNGVLKLCFQEVLLFHLRKIDWIEIKFRATAGGDLCCAMKFSLHSLKVDGCWCVMQLHFDMPLIAYQPTLFECVLQVLFNVRQYRQNSIVNKELINCEINLAIILQETNRRRRDGRRRRRNQHVISHRKILHFIFLLCRSES